MTLASWIDFTSVEDERGRLVAAEAGREIPFDIQRIYYLRDLKPEEPRGFHAHKKIKQVAVCVSGSCEIVLDDGKTRETCRCDNPAKGLLIDRLIWHEMQNFSRDCVLLVFADAKYDERDYIRNYDDFKTFSRRMDVIENFPYIHALADVSLDAIISQSTRIWQFVVILAGAKVGSYCNICANVLIEGDVTIGNRVTVKSGVQIWDGTTVEDDVFIGPNVTFSNDPMPRSRVKPEAFARTVVGRGASIGANATILPGIHIGHHSMIGAGSVVTSDVPAHAVVYGNPARVIRFLPKAENSK